MPQWQLTHGKGYLVTGEPVIVSDLSKSITSSIELLLVAVLVVMAGTLGLIFLGRPRLLPLALALLAAALTFGALSAVGASLTMASIAVLPVLIGLAVDYSIQFQSRVGEALEGAPRRRGAGGASAALISLAAGLGGPTLVTAAAASAAAMLVLLLSPVPMVRGFGLLLVVGGGDRAVLRADGRRGGDGGPARALGARPGGGSRPGRRGGLARSGRDAAREPPDAGRPGLRPGGGASEARAGAGGGARRWPRWAGDWTPRRRWRRTSPSWCPRASARCRP